jgi:hypothetical protein
MFGGFLNSLLASPNGTRKNNNNAKMNGGKKNNSKNTKKNNNSLNKMIGGVSKMITNALASGGL